MAQRYGGPYHDFVAAVGTKRRRKVSNTFSVTALHFLESVHGSSGDLSLSNWAVSRMCQGLEVLAHFLDSTTQWSNWLLGALDFGCAV
ncbi:hypothetical protein ACLKA6_000253 [Drosophila palustris]